VGHCKRLLRQLVRLPLLPASQLLSLLAEEDWEVVEGGEQEAGPQPLGRSAGATRGLPEAVQELVMEALTRLDDQQQVRRWVPACIAVGLLPS
jgi:hypothetical protein